MSLILGLSSFVFSCCCLVGALIALWPEIATRGRRKNIGWWVWITGSMAGLGLFYYLTVMNPATDRALLLPLPGFYRQEATATFKDSVGNTYGTPGQISVDPGATAAGPAAGNTGAGNTPDNPAGNSAENQAGSTSPGNTVLVKAGDSIKYIGGINGNMYHIPGCYLVKRIPAENQRYFKSRAEAETAGYKACPECQP